MLLKIDLETNSPLNTKLASQLDAKSPLPLAVPEGFSLDIAWELLNLIRVAYKNYEIHNHCYEALAASPNQEKSIKATDLFQNNLSAGQSFFMSSRASKGTVDEYYLNIASHAERAGTPASKSEFSTAQELGSHYCQYNVLATFTFLAYSLALPPRPDVNSFGFIVERKTSQSRRVYVIFRGTQEPEEWFNNFQFKQAPIANSFQGPFSSRLRNLDLNVSYGLLKHYTDTRLGPKFLRGLSHYALRASKYVYPVEHNLHHASMSTTATDALQEFMANDTPIYFAGHSLGAALATLSALHIASLCEFDNSNKSTCAANFFLYTYASPRVGDCAFSRECKRLLSAFRVVNSEDIIADLPPSSFNMKGVEMRSGGNGIMRKLSRIRNQNPLSRNTFEHVGVPVCFTANVGALSSNHNLTVTHSRALENMPY